MSGKKLGNLSGITKPIQLKVDQNQLYVEDEQVKLQLYALKNFKLIKSLLKRGEGPGECRHAPYFTIYPDCLYLYSLHKMICVKRNLDYKEEYRINKAFRYIFPIGKNFVGFTDGVNQKTEMGYKDISIYTRDKEFKYKKLLYYCEDNPILKLGQKEDYNLLHAILGFTIYKDKIFLGDPYRGLFVVVFDSNGNELNRINLNMTRQKVTEEFKKKWLEEHWPDKSKWEAFKRMVNPYFPEYFPPFFKFEVNNDKIYFFTYNKRGNENEVIITDLKGKILKKSYVPSTLNKFGLDFTVDNDKYYYIIDNDETEEWEVHVVDIN